VRPVSPSVRYIPAGTTLETAIQANASTGPASNTRGLDRLLPEAPPTAPESRLDLGTDHGAAAAALPSSSAGSKQPPATESASARRAAPPPSAPLSIIPSARSLLDLLFRSQN
jgi:hypothetical protein